MKKMRVLSLCTGIGGIDLAAEAADMEIVGQVELDDFCTSVLAHHWPHVQRMRDLKEVCGDEFGAVELVVAGFPCQPTSHAGKRRGASDDRWLWPDVYRIIRCARPAWVLCENVPGLISLGLDDVLSDLDSAGYEATACVYPASAVGAPHQRERIFIVAHTLRDIRQSSGHDGHEAPDRASARSADVADAAGSTRRGRTLRNRGLTLASDAPVVYASGTGCEECHPSRVASDTGHASGRRDTNGRNGQAQSGVGIAAHGLPGRLAGHPGWPARPGEAQYNWESPRTITGRSPDRAARLKALGNAVVPAQVYPILLAIAKTWRGAVAA